MAGPASTNLTLVRHKIHLQSAGLKVPPFSLDRKARRSFAGFFIQPLAVVQAIDEQVSPVTCPIANSLCRTRAQ